MKRITAVCVMILLSTAGCYLSSTKDNSPPPVEVAVPGEPAAPAEPGPGAVPQGTDPTAAPTAVPAGAVPDGTNRGAAAAPAPATVQLKAEAGVGIKGKSLDKHTGVIVEPAKALLRFEQKSVLEIQIPQALSLFEASEGRKPKSHDEFMSRVVVANNITLPKLPQGHRYIYDPEKGELMVERPAK